MEVRTKAESKQKYLEMTFLGTGQAKDLPMENEIKMKFTKKKKKKHKKKKINVSILRAGESLRSAYPQATPLKRAGALRSFWAMPFSFPAHFYPSAKRERQWWKVKQEKRSQSHTLACTENTWNLHEWRLKLKSKAKIPEPTDGAVTWTVANTSTNECLTGIWIKTQREEEDEETEVSTYVLACSTEVMTSWPDFFPPVLSEAFQNK